jgi:hypothetical protein
MRRREGAFRTGLLLAEALYHLRGRHDCGGDGRVVVGDVVEVVVGGGCGGVGCEFKVRKRILAVPSEELYSGTADSQSTSMSSASTFRSPCIDSIHFLSLQLLVLVGGCLIQRPRLGIIRQPLMTR